MQQQLQRFQCFRGLGLKVGGFGEYFGVEDFGVEALDLRVERFGLRGCFTPP